MSKKAIILFLVVSSFGLGGCAINASSDKMVYKSQNPVKPKSKALIDNVGVGAVQGGKKINLLVTSQIDNPEFKAALEESLRQANLYHKLSGERYVLNSNITSLEQQLFGLNLEVVLRVHYAIEDKQTNKTIYNKTITTNHTATFSDSPVAMLRLRVANEGAARKNIQQLINDVDSL